MGRDGQLNDAEDDELRRLHMFRRFGVVAGRLSSRYDELRSRDRRSQVREPAADLIASESDH
jgi:hypothetical protein